MEDSTLVQFTFGPDAPDFEDEEQLRFTSQLLPELRQVDEVERVDRLEEDTVEEGTKGFTTLAGWLAQMSLATH